MEYYYLYYEDEGPKGICGQSMFTTSPWRHIYIFDDWDKLNEAVEKMKGSRRNQRFQVVLEEHVFEQYEH